MSNKVLITNSQKAVKVPSGLRILIRRACNAVLEYEHFEAPAVLRHRPPSFWMRALTIVL